MAFKVDRHILQWNAITFLWAFFNDIASDGTMMPQLIFALICNSSSNSSIGTASPWHRPLLTHECNSTDKAIVARATDCVKITLRDYNIVGVLMIALLSSLSDLYGRKRVLVVMALGTSLDKLAQALSPNVNVLHYAHAACGTLSSSYLFCAVIFSAVADTSSPANRSRNYAWTEGFLFLGVASGPFIGGAMAKNIGVQAPYYLSGGLYFILAVFIATCVTETLPKEKRAILQCFDSAQLTECCLKEPAEEEKLLAVNNSESTNVANPKCHRRTISWIILTPIGSAMTLLQSWTWVVLTVMLLTHWIPVRSIHFTFSLFAKRDFGWGAFETGIFFSLRMVALFIGSGPMSHIIKLRNQDKVAIGAMFGIMTYGAFTFLTRQWMFYAGSSLFMLFAWMTPCLRGTASNYTSVSKQGSVLGAAGTLEAISGICAPVMFAPLFKWLLKIDYEHSMLVPKEAKSRN
ncbi:tetracycline resistance protein, class B-like isoform X2 [Oscarella lobularis]|uniref:tetracycline resistance protein, class B-like isoform X2 n=1 Tax=Oscarella lobularis TaxID=121494 RepID=UPI0033138884